MNLYDIITAARKEYNPTEYKLSISELVSNYKENDLRLGDYDDKAWSHETKVNFIESILLGLPIPSIYIVHNEDATWTVLDGNQRVATILEFVGVLRDSNGDVCKPLVLSATEALPELEGARWDNYEDFPVDLRNDIRYHTTLNALIIDVTEFQSETEILQLRSALNTHR